MARVFRTRQSREDYLTIWLYIAKDNVEAADKLVEKFDQTISLIAGSPRIGRDRSDLAPDLRSVPVGEYIIFFRPRSDGVQLIRVLHSKRNIRRIMFGK